MKIKKRFFLPRPDPSVPLFLESVGFNPEQEPISRSEGFPYYHWLQTAVGEGKVTFGERTVVLPPNYGVLFLPHVPHRYEAITAPWETYYITFGGPLAVFVLESLGLHDNIVFHWPSESEQTSLVQQMLTQILSQRDVTGLDYSVAIYRFLVSLKKHGKIDRHPSIHHLVERLTPLLQWLESDYTNPDLGTDEMAAIMGVSPRHLNSLFKQALGVTPYRYLIYLRIRKAKEWMVREKSLPVKEIASRVGFRDTSHFIATFRMAEGTSPQKYRERYDLNR